MKPTLYLHVGLHKTATTAIQSFAGVNAEVLINKHGLYYPNYEFDNITYPDKKKRDISHHAFARAVVGKDRFLSKTDAARLVASWAQHASSLGCSCMLSAESISVLTYRKLEPEGLLQERRNYLEAIRSLLSQSFNVIPVIVLRRPDEYLESFYKEKLLKFYGSDFISFEEYCEVMFRPGSALYFNQSVELIEDVFSEVKVLSYEGLKSSDFGVVGGFFMSLGFDVGRLPTSMIVRPSLSIPEVAAKLYAAPNIHTGKANAKFLTWLAGDEIQGALMDDYGSKKTLWGSGSKRANLLLRLKEELCSVGDRFPELPADWLDFESNKDEVLESGLLSLDTKAKIDRFLATNSG